MVEEHNLAAHDCFTVGVVDEVLEERVINEAGAYEVPPAGLADVDRPESGGNLVAVEGRRLPRVVVVGSDRPLAAAHGSRTAGRVPALYHTAEHTELTMLRHRWRRRRPDQNGDVLEIFVSPGAARRNFGDGVLAP
ncbi:hypothetical protein HPP92_015585 [Vanilla planifolia]|uniref:Uncharacterized protein n=1 Tax=Vanilla planifolia TaxID=51239 RepID=A0A835UPP2_VANPL|nr:hypothetical protein HPP92_015585 [Vanilla planifolia]